MIGFFWNLTLALAWIALTGSFSGLNFVLGFAISYLFLAVIQSQVPVLRGYAQRVPLFVLFLLFFVKELVKANYKVAFDVLTPPWHMKPGVIGLPLEATTDLEVTMVANFISLTPGTLSLDISDDRRVLFIHAMFLQDEQALIRELKEIERRILEIMR
ncbi:Na+/H+ antiporter subunit E [Marinimicrobium alkaliphilum]|uniref:Na+/H+ antiporter subunit E n=1 Tax=Marinimicrobium alkaliphilum TaxID=2202654 RepID=UPI000DB9B24C|nr:Na+/H+ antiporter subunit E [Marinimicrobium alkaliphilum]